MVEKLYVTYNQVGLEYYLESHQKMRMRSQYLGVPLELHICSTIP
jgi:hypothetical protein